MPKTHLKDTMLWVGFPFLSQWHSLNHEKTGARPGDGMILPQLQQMLTMTISKHNRDNDTVYDVYLTVGAMDIAQQQ